MLFTYFTGIVVLSVIILDVRGAIDKFAEFSSQEFISLSNDMKTCIQVKRLIISFIIR